jgi:hypothetical protein
VQASGGEILELIVPAPTTNSRHYDAWFTTNLMGSQWQNLNFNRPGANDGSALTLTVTNTVDSAVYRTGVKVP